MLTTKVLTLFKALSGNVDGVTGSSLADDLCAIKFNKPLYPEEPWAHELYGIDEFFKKNRTLFKKDRKAFDEKLLKDFFAPNPPPRAHTIYNARLFTPLTPGTADYDEWHDWFEDEDVDLKAIIKRTKTKLPEFVQITDSFSYPDQYFVCTADPSTANPTVWGTDHEVFFREVEDCGSLADYLEGFLTEDAFMEAVAEYLDSENAG